MLTMRSLLPAVLLLLAACSGPRQNGRTFAGPAGVTDFLALRSYDLPTQDPEPQAVWSPNGRWLLVRSQRSLRFLREGAQRVHHVGDGRRPGHAQWLDDLHVIFGPEQWVVTTEDGRVLPPADGLRVLTLRPNDFRVGDEFARGAWRPRIWGKEILAQRGGDIFRYEIGGLGERYDEGYLPEPRRDGKAVALQTVPLGHPDHWTGSDGLGHLLVRWPGREVRLYAGCLEPVWCGDGSLLATRLKRRATAGEAWWAGGSDIVHIAGPEAEPRLVLADARHPAPHPQCQVFAACSAEDAVVLAERDGDGRRLLQSGAGRPCWSNDGRRLAMEIHDPATDTVTMRVMIFKVAADAAADSP